MQEHRNKNSKRINANKIEIKTRRQNNVYGQQLHPQEDD